MLVFTNHLSKMFNVWHDFGNRSEALRHFALHQGARGAGQPGQLGRIPVCDLDPSKHEDTDWDTNKMQLLRGFYGDFMGIYGDCMGYFDGCSTFGICCAPFLDQSNK